MTAAERNDLRDFLLYVKNGGRPGDGRFGVLKQTAEDAVCAARQRLKKYC